MNKITDEEWLEWYNDFENMYPSSYQQRHKELKLMYPNLYNKDGTIKEREDSDEDEGGKVA